MQNKTDKPLLKVEGLKQYFKVNGNFVVKAVDDVSFEVYPGETYGLVGESGSGKSVASKAIMGILAENGRITDGSMTYTKENGEEIDLAKLSEHEYHKIRGKEIAMVFQDPMTSLNPTMTIGKQIMEPIMKHQGCSKAEVVQDWCSAMCC